MVSAHGDGSERWALDVATATRKGDRRFADRRSDGVAMTSRAR
jgi:hypothetical protein